MKIGFNEIKWIDSAVGLRVKTFENAAKKVRTCRVYKRLSRN